MKAKYLTSQKEFKTSRPAKELTNQNPKELKQPRLWTNQSHKELKYSRLLMNQYHYRILLINYEVKTTVV